MPNQQEQLPLFTPKRSGIPGYKQEETPGVDIPDSLRRFALGSHGPAISRPSQRPVDNAFQIAQAQRSARKTAVSPIGPRQRIAGSPISDHITDSLKAAIKPVDRRVLDVAPPGEQQHNYETGMTPSGSIKFSRGNGPNAMSIAQLDQWQKNATGIARPGETVTGGNGEFTVQPPAVPDHIAQTVMGFKDMVDPAHYQALQSIANQTHSVDAINQYGGQFAKIKDQKDQQAQKVQDRQMQIQEQQQKSQQAEQDRQMQMQEKQAQAQQAQQERQSKQLIDYHTKRQEIAQKQLDNLEKQFPDMDWDKPVAPEDTAGAAAHLKHATLQKQISDSDAEILNSLKPPQPQPTTRPAAAQANPQQTTQQPTQNNSAHPEGSILHSPSTGRMYRIQNGQLVPFTPPPAQGAAAPAPQAPGGPQGPQGSPDDDSNWMAPYFNRTPRPRGV